MARSNDDDGVRVEKGASLARLLPLILGPILLAFGLLGFRHNAHFPPGSNFTDGTANGSNFLGIEVNGWTNFFTATAGGLLLFGAAQHLLSRTMSLIVGLGLGACSVIALVDKRDVLGLAAANGLTKLAWGAAAALLLVNSLLPRLRHKVEEPVVERERTREVVERPAPTPPVEPAPVVETRPVETQRVETRPVETQRVETRPVETRPVESRPVDTRPVDRGDAVGGGEIVAEPGDAASRETERDLGRDRPDDRSL